jgi:hypothetical protein
MSDEGSSFTSPHQGADSGGLYQKKYYTLKRKCEEIQQTNEKLVNQIQQVKRIIRHNVKAKRFMMAKLDRYRDNYMNVQVPAMFDDVADDDAMIHSVSLQRDNLGLNFSHDFLDGSLPPNVNPFLNSSGQISLSGDGLLR